MTIPYPDNPQHVENLASVELMAAQGFKGTDATLSISLFEYGLAWREIDKEVLFVYSIGNKKFDRVVFALDTDIQKEWDWVDWDALLQFVGESDITEYLEKNPITQVVFDLLNYYGYENVFGTSYWEGFKIKG